MMMLEERRSRRSGDQLLALRFQLESSRDRGGLDALVLADEDGLVLASAGENELCEEIGAYAPLLDRSPFGLQIPMKIRSSEVAIRPLLLNGHRLFLACLGGGTARDAHLRTSESGVKRILATN